MKIGILTFQGSNNYGATLQTYALQRYIAQQGHDCEVIDLYRNGFKGYVSSKRFKAFSAKREGWMQALLHRLFGKKKKREGVVRYPLTEVLREKIIRFNHSIPLSKPYCSIDALYADVPPCDVYVTGSDQVWNPYRGDCVEPYFLTFAPKGARCISYAASLGVSRLGENVEKKYAEWLRRYEAISVREDSARTIIQGLTPTPVERVLDPTFLLTKDEWLSLAHRPERKKPYLLLFSLLYYPKMLEYGLKLAAESGLELLYMTQRQPAEATGNYTPINNAGYEDFIGLINDAEMLITDSFHGTAFALQTNCNNVFTYISNPKRSSRITELYELLGVDEHVLHPELDESYAELAARKLDRDRIADVIARESQNSRTYLNRHLC